MDQELLRLQSHPKNKKPLLKSYRWCYFTRRGLTPRGNVNRQRQFLPAEVAADPIGPRVTRLLRPEEGSEVTRPCSPHCRWAGTSGGAGTGCFQRTKCWRCPGFLWVAYTEWVLQSSTRSPAGFLFCNQVWKEKWSGPSGCCAAPLLAGTEPWECVLHWSTVERVSQKEFGTFRADVVALKLAAGALGYCLELLTGWWCPFPGCSQLLWAAPEPVTLITVIWLLWTSVFSENGWMDVCSFI